MADGLNIEELQIQITAEANSAVSAINKLARNLRTLGSIKLDASNIKEFVKELTNLGRGTGLQKIANDLTAIARATSKIQSVNRPATQVQNTATPRTNIEQMIQQYGSAEDALYGLAGAENTVASSAAKAEKQTGVLGKSLKALATSAVSASKSLINGFKGVLSIITNLVQRIARIAFIRMIRSAIKGITNAVKEGTNALIEWDRVYGNNTSYAAKTADEIAAKWGQVKKSLGAAAMPIIQQLQPALMSLMNTVIAVAEGLNMVIRALQGYTTYMVGTTGKIGEGLEDATGKAKALQRVLFGFDELNVLPSPSGSGSGTASATVGAGEFMEKVMDSELLRKAQSIFELVKGIGKALLSWKIAKTFLTGLGLADTTVSGLALSIGGAVLSFTQLKEQLTNGVNWTNLAGLVGGLSLTVVGLGKAFGSVGASIGLLASGVVLAVAPIKELIQIGRLSAESMTQLAIAIVAVSGGISLLTGSIVPLLAGGLLAGVIALSREAAEAERTMVEAIEIEKYGSTLDDLNQKIQDNIQALRDRRSEILNSQTPQEEELALADRLAKKYFELSKKSSLTADEKERMASYSAELLKIYPELNEYLDDENGLLHISEEEWRKIYEAKLKDIKLEARREKLIELEKQQVETEIKLQEAAEDVTRAYEVWQDTITRKNNLPGLIEQLQDIHAKVQLASGSTDTLTESEKKLFDQYTNNSGKVSDLREAIIELYKEQDNADENIENARDAYNKLKGKLGELQTEYNNTEKVIESVSKGLYDKTAEIANGITISPVKIPVQVSNNGVQTGLASIWKTGANSVNDNPLLLPVRPSGIGYAEWNSQILKGYNAIRGYATGGVPDVGTLFYAGEAGAEVVANMGHSTGVMNMSQMQEAVASGNMEVVNAVYAMANMVVNAVNNKDLDVYMDSAKVGQSVSKYQYNQARRGVPQGAY